MSDAGPMQSPPSARPPKPPMSKTDWALVALAVVLLGAGAGFWLQRRGETPAPPPPPAPLAEAPAAAPPQAAPAAPLPPGDQAALLEAVSRHALVRRGLGAGDGDVIERWVVVTDNLAEGVSPRKALAFLEPKQPFAVADRGGATVIAPESYRRYDAFADAVGSVDAAAVARAYRALHEVAQAAYRALGYPGASLDEVTAKALRRLAGAPVADRELTLVAAPQGALWLFADPKLEALPAVEKHLVRMGPRNGRIVQAKARELLAALGLPPK